MNPFKYGTVVSGEFFYDREEELQRIKQTLSGGNNLMLYAPRRYGKSSLVKKALMELKEEGFTTIYMDFMSVYSRETFIKNYTKAIAGQQSTSLENVVKKIAGLLRGLVPSLAFDVSGNPTFTLSWIEGKDEEQTLTDAINLPEKLASGDSRWIVAFDEFQEIDKLNGESFEKLLRSCLQHHEHVSYLFLGSRTHLLQDMFNNKNRAFYNAAMLMNIETIDTGDSVAYLQSRFKYSGILMPEQVAFYMIDKVNNIPYYIQFVAAEIWQQLVLIDATKKVSIENVDTAISKIVDIKSDYYWELTQKHTNYRKKVLYALSLSVEEIFSKSITAKFNLGAVSTTQKALDSFISDGIIERINKNYEFSDPIYKMFLQQHL
jgi:AAA+ ATPase superfamily predicted ATPase